MARKKKTKVKLKEKQKESVEGFSVGDTVWFTYVNGRIMSGDIDAFFVSNEINGATIITPSDGYRSVPLSSCSYQQIIKKRTKKKL
ncbi:hypothetical protein OAA09_00065 [bacterium]|nr:hypothetical protein [bacterium]